MLKRPRNLTGAVCRVPALGISLKRPNALTATRLKLPRRPFGGNRVGGMSQFVVYAMQYEEEDLFKLTNKELHKIMIENAIRGWSGKRKSELVERIIKHQQKLKAEAGKKPEIEPVDFSLIKFETRAELIDKLRRFTMTELKVELRRRRTKLIGLKMEVVERLASLMEEERLEAVMEKEDRYASEIPSGFTTQLEDLETMDQFALRDFLRQNMRKSRVKFSKYLDLLHFVYCLLMSDAVLNNPDKPKSKESVMELIERSQNALKAENQNNRALKARCNELNISVAKTDTRETILERIAADEAAQLEMIYTETESVQEAIFYRLKEWLEEIHQQLSGTPVMKEIAQLSEETVSDQVRAASMRSDSEETSRELLRGLKMVETHFFPRSLTILASQMIHRVLLLNMRDWTTLLDLQPDQIEKLSLSDAYRDIVRQAFFNAVKSVFNDLYDRVMEESDKTEETLNQYRIDKEVEEDEVDAPICIGVIFGGARAQGKEIFSSVRCLLDHLQTAPFNVRPLDDSEEAQVFGMRVGLYYIGSGDDGVHVYRMTAAEFLSLDRSAFYYSSNGIWDLGEKIPDLSAFLHELAELDGLISLTPSLDALAGFDKAHSEMLSVLDPTFIGSPAASRRLTNNRYGCLTYLRKKGFIVPPMHRIQKKDLEEMEIWNKGFENWSVYHKLSKEQTFYLRASSPHDRYERLECEDLGQVVAAARTVFQLEGMEEAIIQPIPPAEHYVEFACVVLQTAAGPVALAPTEFEELPAEHVRTMSTPVRRHTPPRFTIDKVQAMRRTAERVFEELQLSGYACIHGQMMIDPAKEAAIKNEKLTYPRPIPDMPNPLGEVTYPPGFLEHMEKLEKEHEKELDDLVKSYDQSTYTIDTLKYFQFCDQEDAKHGRITNRYKQLEAIIETIRHRHDYVEDKEEEPTPLEILMGHEMMEEANEVKERPSPVELSTGEDFSILITEVESTMLLTPDSLLFQQAAVSGLSHGSVLRHLLNLKLPPELQLLDVPSAPQQWNPFYPDSYVEEGYDPDAPRPEQVWILCGGDGTGHQASLASGVNALIKLNRMNDIQPYLFVMDPGRRVSASPDVLKGLGDRRKSLLEQGVPLESLPEECSGQYIASPKTIVYDMPWKPVWCMHHAHLLYSTIDAAVEASERLRLLESTAVLSHTTLTTDFKEMLITCQTELHKAGVVGVAALWGGDVDEVAPAPRMMTMDIFAAEAFAVGATIFLAAHGDAAQDGTLQSFLESYNLSYTGCGVTASQLCGDKDQTAQYLENLDSASSLAQRYVVLPELVECGQDKKKAEKLYAQTCKLLGGIINLCIKPTKDGFGAGVARISCPEDMYMYGKALEERWEAIYNFQLTDPHCTLPMPKPQAKEYLIESYVQPAKPFDNEAGDLVIWDKLDHIEVSFGLVGDLGRMWVFTPSMIVSNLESQEPMEDRLLHGMKSAITPIPETIAHPDIVAKAKKHVENLADSMGLRGVARVDAYMDVDDGSLMIIEVDTTPFLGEHSVIFQQAVLENPPMFPDEVFQQILQVAFTSEPEIQQEEQPEEIVEEEAPAMDPWEDSEFLEREEERRRQSAQDTSEPLESLSSLWDSDDEEQSQNQTLRTES